MAYRQYLPTEEQESDLPMNGQFLPSHVQDSLYLFDSTTFNQQASMFYSNGGHSEQPMHQIVAVPPWTETDALSQINQSMSSPVPMLPASVVFTESPVIYNQAISMAPTPGFSIGTVDPRFHHEQFDLPHQVQIMPYDSVSPGVAYINAPTAYIDPSQLPSTVDLAYTPSTVLEEASSYHGSDLSSQTAPSDCGSDRGRSISRVASQQSLDTMGLSCFRSQQSVAAVLGSSRVEKLVKSPAKKGGKRAPKQRKGKSKPKTDTDDREPVRFKCTFAFAGCPDSFGAKNEWKRHVLSQHMRFTVWVCNRDGCQSSNKSPFSRRDLFGEHLKRMHLKYSELPVSDEEFAAMVDEAENHPRNPPTFATCNICDEQFNGEKAWDTRMEHTGGHYDRGEDPLEEQVPYHLLDWMLKSGVIMPVQATSNNDFDYGIPISCTQYVLAHDSKNTRTPARAKSASPDAAVAQHARGHVRARSGAKRLPKKRMTKRQASIAAAAEAVAMFDHLASDRDAEGEADE